jgi:hypothetical protein
MRQDSTKVNNYFFTIASILEFYGRSCEGLFCFQNRTTRFQLLSRVRELDSRFGFVPFSDAGMGVLPKQFTPLSISLSCACSRVPPAQKLRYRGSATPYPSVHVDRG